MLYSAEALDVANSIAWRFGRMLKRAALERAKRDGREVVTADDVRMSLTMAKLGPILHDTEES